MKENIRASSPQNAISGYFPYVPTQCQREALKKLESAFHKNSSDNTFLIQGYAGTGKTTLVKAIADTCSAFGQDVILLSPTGRGAKVLSDITRHDAYTIHKHIYNFELKPDGRAIFTPAVNKYSDSVFVIDEASMISGVDTEKEDSFYITPDGGLLKDLFDYINSNKNNKIIIVGDPAQLPPVNFTVSPALDERYLLKNFNIKPVVISLKDVVRHAHGSGILMNATKIRTFIENNRNSWPVLETENYDDIGKFNAERVREMLHTAFTEKNNDVVIITVSNKTANKYNNYIRKNILLRENIIDADDIIMAVKNNYFWLYGFKNDFIANGEMMLVKSVRNCEQKYGYNFADLDVKLLYQKKEPVISVKVLLDTLNLPAPALSHEQFMALWNNIINSYGGRITKKKSMKILREDPYINALQIKFAWAFTCHKAQGGQWKRVFVDTEFLLKRHADISGLRWLYTAITRTSEKLIILR